MRPTLRGIAGLLILLMLASSLLANSGDPYTETVSETEVVNEQLTHSQQVAIDELNLGIQRSDVGARTYGTNWAVKAGGGSADYGNGIAVDSSGNAYVTGYFQDTATFGSTSLISAGNADIFIAKLSSSGSWQWAVKAGGSSSDSGYVIAVDSGGNAYVTGYFYGTATFGSTSLSSSGSKDIFIAKLSSSGSWQWAVRAGGSSNDEGGGIAVDSSGNAYVTGYFYGTVTFGSTSLTSSGWYDIFIAKLSSSGSWQWAVRAGGSSNDEGGGIAVDSSGNAYVTGFFSGTATFGSTSLSSSGSYDIFIAKLSSSGSWTWAAKAGGSSSDSSGDGIAVDSGGNAYVTGYFRDTVTFGSTSLTSSGSYDIFIAKLSSSGSWQWVVKAGGSDIDRGYGIAVDSSGNAYVTGFFEGTATFGSTSLTSSGNNDLFIGRLSSSGSWQWAVNAGGSSNDVGYGIAVDSGGNAYVTGYFQDTATFGSTSLTSSGSLDIFIAKLNGANSDNDLLPSGWDNCPNIANDNQADHDGDEDGDVCDDDDDNDTVLDVDDDCSTGKTDWVSNASTDHDGDGCRDVTWPESESEDWDDDNDGIYDSSDWCPTGDLNWISSNITDYDDDGCQDSLEDTDDDNDGVLDVDDSCPTGAIPANLTTGWLWLPYEDIDGDGCTNWEDDDDDNDDVLDVDDDCSGEMNSIGWSSNSSTDHDGDGCRDSWEEDEDDDNDGRPDEDDSCQTGDLDWTSTSIGSWSRWPADWDQANSTDWDQDGCRDDGEDLDDDGDGVNDTVDLCPRGYTGDSWQDWTGDPDNDDDGCHDYVGTADNSTSLGSNLGEDTDDDNDQHLDHQDTCRTLFGTSNLILEDGPITMYALYGVEITIQVDQIGCPDEDGDDWPELGIAGDGMAMPGGEVNYVSIDMFNNDSTQWWDTDGDGKGDNFANAEEIRESYWPGWFVEGANNSDSSPLDQDDDGFQDFDLLLNLDLIDSSIDPDQVIIGEAPDQLWDLCQEEYGTAMWGWQAGEIYGWKVYSGGCIDGDGDLYMDSRDWDLEDGSQWADTDSDGFGDNEDGFEGDGCPNTWGDSWRDRHGCVDGDSDGQSDFGDLFEKDASQWADTDGDGFGDNWGDQSWNESRKDEWPGGWAEGAYKPDPSPLDYDNDGFEDGIFPAASGDLDDCQLQFGLSYFDSFGCPDSDGDGWSDLGDLVPNDPTQWMDSDGDGFGDSADGTFADSCPNEAGNSTRDRYGCLDLDGDGWSYIVDFNDNNTELWSDIDGDGFPDQPGFDNSDDCVNQAGQSTSPWKGCSDMDLDGIMDLADDDTDGDGISDAYERTLSEMYADDGIVFDPYDSSSTPEDFDGDHIPDDLDDDWDDDGFPNLMELERGSDAWDDEQTPLNMYGEQDIGFFYKPGEGFLDYYDPEAYEVSASSLIAMATSEALIPILLFPFVLFLAARRRWRFKRFRRRLDDAESLEELDDAEEDIDWLISRNKVKIQHALLLRNMFERKRDMFSGNGGKRPPSVVQERGSRAPPRSRGRAPPGRGESDYPPSSSVVSRPSGRGPPGRH